MLTKYTVEFFFRTMDPTSADIEVILGMSPVKIRKKANTGKIHLFYGTTTTLEYCSVPTALSTGVWHHFSFSINEETQSVKCYFDGNSVAVGANPLVIIAGTIDPPTEMVLGYSSDMKTLEEPF